MAYKTTIKYGDNIISSFYGTKNITLQTINKLMNNSINIDITEVEPTLYVFNQGDENTSVTGGWKLASATTGSSLVNTSGQLQLTRSGNQGRATITNAIDLTPYSVMKINLVQSPMYLEWGLYDKTMTSVLLVEDYISGTGIKTLDISSINQLAKPWFAISCTTSGTMKVDKVWFE